MRNTQAVILVDHGSRRPSANAALNELAQLVRPLLGVPVYEAHMELAKPSLADSLGSAVADGATQVVVCPVFLSAGRHAAKDIPDLVMAATQNHPSVHVVVSDPLGVDALLAELVTKRVRPHLNALEAS